MRPSEHPPRKARAATQPAAMAPRTSCFRWRFMAILTVRREGPALKGIAGNDLAAETGRQRLEGGQAQTVLQEADAAVAEDEVGPAGMVARVRRLVREVDALVVDRVLHVLVVDHQVAEI